MCGRLCDRATSQESRGLPDCGGHGYSLSVLVRTANVSATRALAADVARLTRGGDVIVLAGEMGAGKTAFTQGFARALGVTEAVTSPTFTLVQSYPAHGGLTLHHLDVYRLDRMAEVSDLGLEELIEPRGVTVIEWGDAIADVLPDDRLEIRFEFADDESERDVSIDVLGPSWRKREQALIDAVENLARA
jgi:tRNA threonylcarbamoyladenosine biosynthesis protein TsaE